jgi:hypothetical protein
MGVRNTVVLLLLLLLLLYEPTTTNYITANRCSNQRLKSLLRYDTVLLDEWFVALQGQEVFIGLLDPKTKAL